MRVPERVGAAALVLPFVLGALSAASPSADDVVFRFGDSDIVESSGLAVVDGLFATVNDSGDSGRVFTVDPGSGDTVGVTSWSGDPTDVEAIAPAGDGQVWVGDIGDNRGSRDSVRIARVPVGRGDREVDVDWRDLTYPDGPRDAECLLAHPVTGRLLVITKGALGGTVYAVPPSSDTLRPLASAPGLVTDGAFLPDGRHLILRTYDRAFVYTYPAFEKVGSLDLPEQEQGEGLAVAPDGQVYLSSEGSHQPVLRVALPRSALGPARGVSPPPPPTPAEAPAPGPAEPAADGATRWPWLAGGLALLVGGLLLGWRRLR